MIELLSVSKTFSGRKAARAVDDISLRCEPGRAFALLGPNGSGKTTALRMIATLMKPTAGSVRVMGLDSVTQAREIKRRLGFLTGMTALYARLTARETVRYFASLWGLERKASREREEMLFAKLGIDSFANERVHRMSLGMKQRVSIARALIHNPDVLVLDEPTSGLDVISSRAIIDLVREAKSEGRTVLFSTHIMGEVSLLGDDLAIMSGGRLKYCGTFAGFQAAHGGQSLEDAFLTTVGKTES